MAGGIAVLLLIIALLVVGGIALALYGTGGFLWFRKTDEQRDRIADATDDASARDRSRRPQHQRPTAPAQDRTDFVGGREPRPHR